jgi:NADH-quinone oxidoreductase subunit M
MLWMFQRVFYGPVPERLRSVRDLTVAEAMLVIPLIVLIFWIGLRPLHFTRPLEQAATFSSALSAESHEIGRIAGAR